MSELAEIVGVVKQCKSVGSKGHWGEYGSRDRWACRDVQGEVAVDTCGPAVSSTISGKRAHRHGYNRVGAHDGGPTEVCAAG